MNANVVDSGIELMKSTLASGASVELRLDRDKTDSYVISLQQTTPHSQLIDKNDVMSLIPAGSNWTPSVGWRSFCGIPKKIGGQSWLFLGAAGVREHKTRGAYPVLVGFFYPADEAPITGLRRIARQLRAAENMRPSERDSRSRVESDSLGYSISYGVLRAKSRTPIEHIPVEIEILEAAASAYEAGKELVFRTLVLSEDELNLGFRGANFLYAVVPSIERSFSRKTRGRLLAHRAIL